MPLSKVISYAEPWMPLPTRVIIRAIESCTGRSELKRRYSHYQQKAQNIDGRKLWDLALDTLGLHGKSTNDFKLPERDKTKGLLIVANHPFGVIDGIVLAWIASRIDPNFRIIANGVLRQEPTLNPNILPIEFSPKKIAIKKNIESRRFSINRLKEGGVVAIFPAGAVSWSKTRNGPIEDDDWKPMVGRLINASKCDVLPVKFSGANSQLFQLASRTALSLRLGLYLRESRRCLDNPIEFKICPLLKNSELPKISDKNLAHWLRDLVIKS